MIGEVAGIGTGFKGAITYLLMGKKHEPNPDRVAWTQLRNLPTDNPKLAPRLMRATANQSARCRKPLYHLVLSWREDENPTDELMLSHVDDTLRDLDLLDHQTFIAAHKDTKHRHVHLIINRVHPETTRAWSRSMDYARIEQSIRRQMEARGLDFVPGRHNAPEKFGLKPKHVKRGEYRKAIHSGDERPLDHWSTGQINERRESLLRCFDGARSWDQLSRMLQQDGIHLKRKGQGIVLEGADGFMKLSELRKDIRLAALENLYGERFSSFADRNPEVLVRTRHAERRKTAPDFQPTPVRKPQPADTDSTDDSALPTDPAELERLREEAKQERIARREEELARRTEERRKHSSAAGGNGAAAPPTARTLDPPQHAAAAATSQDHKPTASPRDEAFDNLGQSREALDLAKRLHDLRIVTDAQLQRAKDAVENAEDKLDQQLSMAERLTNEIGDALRGMSRATAKTAAPRREPPKPAPEPPPKKRKRPKFKKRDRDGRDR